MKVIQSTAGSLELNVSDLPIPDPGPGTIRVRVAAAAVNPADVMIAFSDLRASFDLPATVGLGWDVSGVVSAVGEDVDGYAVGDRVAALHSDLSATSRTHAEEVVVPAAAAAHVPAELDLADAGSVSLNVLTARQALDDLDEPAGRSLLVTGAGGAVGGYAVALAAGEGWAVTGLGRTKDEEFVRLSGAGHFVIDLPAAGFDVVLDAAGLQERALDAVRDGGRFHGVYPISPVQSQRGITVSTVMVQQDGVALAELLRRSAAGELAVRVAGTVSLEEAHTAYAKLAAGGQRGRWLLVP